MVCIKQAMFICMANILTRDILLHMRLLRVAYLSMIDHNTIFVSWLKLDTPLYTCLNYLDPCSCAYTHNKFKVHTTPKVWMTNIIWNKPFAAQIRNQHLSIVPKDSLLAFEWHINTAYCVDRITHQSF